MCAEHRSVRQLIARRAQIWRRLCLLAAGSFAWSLAAQEQDQAIAVPGLWSTGNPFLDGFIVALVVGVFWAAFYWGLYPRLLPLFGEVGARGIFWSGFVLYLFTWLHLSCFTIYSLGFVYGWLQWSFLIVVPLLSLWFLLSFVRS